MSNMGLTAEQQGEFLAGMHPLTPDDVQPGALAGLWKAPFTGMASVLSDVALLGVNLPSGIFDDQLSGVPQSPSPKTMDETRMDMVRGMSEMFAPDPRTTGIVSQYVHGFFNIVPEAIIGGPLMAAGLQGNKGFLTAQSQGVDTGTALGMGLIDAAATYAGLKIPVKLAPALGGAANTALSAGVFPVVGIVSRGTSSALLEANGYHEMAAQIKPLDATAIVADMIMGAGFGALAHYGPKAIEAYKAFQERNAGKISEADLDTAATILNAAHLDETAPGVPADPATQSAHADYLKANIESMMRGEEPPPPPTEVVDGNFVPNPIDTAVRQEISNAVREHLGELGDLEAELARRGLPIDPNLYARGGRTGDTVEAVTTAARGAFGGNSAALVDSGAVRVVDSPSELPARPDGQTHPTDARGYFDGERVWLVAKNLPAGDVKATILHEVGAHVGMEQMLGADLYAKLLGEVTERAQAGEAGFVEGLRQVPVDTPAGQVPAETLAYLVENRPELPLVKKLLSQVKTALYRLLGGRLVKLNADDIRTLAVAALRRVSRADAVRSQAEGFYNRDVGAIERPTTPLPFGATELEVDGVQRPALNSEGKPIHWSQEGVRNFWRWFSDSKAIDAEGRPLVVYHGGPDLITAFDFTHGAYFAADRQRAKGYADVRSDDGGQVTAAYLRIRAPEMLDGASDGDFQRFTDRRESDAALVKKGFDGQILNFENNLFSNDYRVTSPEQIKSATGNRGTFDPEQGNIMYARAKPGVESPGVGVEQQNRHGVEPSLRVKVKLGRMQLPTNKSGNPEALFTQTTNLKNAARQITAIDAVLARFPDADQSPAEWSRMMAYALATDEPPIPPYRFLQDINSDGAYNSLSRLSEGQIADANHGFENARAFRKAYVGKQLTVETTGKLFLWSFLSRGVSPYTQEGLFIDAFRGIDEWVKKAADGNFTEADFDAYEDWAKSVAPKGSGQPGAGATHNLNAFGNLFLFKMGQRDAEGVSLMQRMHTLMEDPNSTGQQIRRWFQQNTEGVGIDNKVVSFTLLVAGFKDVMVIDRVQVRQLWDDGRFGDRNLYDGENYTRVDLPDGRKVKIEAIEDESDADFKARVKQFVKDQAAELDIDVKDIETSRVKIAGSALSDLTYGARGLLIYEAIERALASRINNIYSALGRPQDASIGRYHWESWVADSQQEASHGTLDAILHDARGDSGMISGVTAKEGEYGSYNYGARYGRDAEGNPYFQYRTPSGGEYRFTREGFRSFVNAVKSPDNGVIPKAKRVKVGGKTVTRSFKVTEAGNAPWFERPEVNKQALDAVAQRYAVEPGAADGARPVRPNGEGQAVPNRTGSADPQAAQEVVRLNPALTVPDETGAAVPASRVLAQADAEIARAESDSPQYEAAAACFLRG